MKAISYKCEQCGNVKIDIVAEWRGKFLGFKRKNKPAKSFVTHCEICKAIKTFIKAI